MQTSRKQKYAIKHTIKRGNSTIIMHLLLDIKMVILRLCSTSKDIGALKQL